MRPSPFAGFLWYLHSWSVLRFVQAKHTYPENNGDCCFQHWLAVSCLISSDALVTAASSASSSVCVPSTPPWLAALEVSLLSCC